MDNTLRYNSAMLDFLVEYFYDHGIWHVAEPTNIPIYVGPITIQPKYNDVWDKERATSTNKRYYWRKNYHDIYSGPLRNSDGITRNDFVFQIPKIYRQQRTDFMKPIKTMAEYCHHNTRIVKDCYVVITPTTPIPYPTNIKPLN